MLEFGSLLRVLRSELRLTQTEMAELLCISQPVYSRMEAGVRPIPVKALERLADRRHISVQALFLAYLFLDENLAVIEGGVRDEASLALLELAARSGLRRWPGTARFTACRTTAGSIAWTGRRERWCGNSGAGPATAWCWETAG